ncbi:hypothetical protein PV458_07455 [Streptomyces sp. MN03-5084-2B]|nr:hypothetical protein [Streptomyces sp. MN03-5084-2B]
MREDNVRKIWSEAELDAALADLNSDVGEDDGLAFARSSLLAAAGVEEAPPAEPRRSGVWRWVSVAAAVVTLVGGLGIAATAWTPDPSPETSRPAASLPDLDRPLTPGEYRYAQKLTWVPEIIFGLPAWAQQKVELWIPADPTGVWRRRTMWTGVVQGLAPGQQKDVQVNLAPRDESAPGGVFPPDGQSDGAHPPHWSPAQQKWLQPDAAFVASLARDQVELRKRLTFAGDGGVGRVYTPTESLTMVRSVLELGLAPKNIRFALTEAFGAVPAAFVTSGHTPDGRSAMVLGVKDSGQRLYLDPSTAQPLAWEAAQPVPVITRSSNIPLTTPFSAPPSMPITPKTTTTQKPDPAGPVTVYTYAITRTSG